MIKPIQPSSFAQDYTAADQHHESDERRPETYFAPNPAPFEIPLTPSDVARKVATIHGDESRLSANALSKVYFQYPGRSE